MSAVDRDALVRYFGSFEDVIAITDVQAVIENWPTSTVPLSIDEVWNEFYDRIIEWSEFLNENTDQENDGNLRELLWELIARVLLVKSP